MLFCHWKETPAVSLRAMINSCDWAHVLHPHSGREFIVALSRAAPITRHQLLSWDDHTPIIGRDWNEVTETQHVILQISLSFNLNYSCFLLTMGGWVDGCPHLQLYWWLFFIPGCVLFQGVCHYLFLSIVKLIPVGGGGIMNKVKVELDEYNL